MKENSYQIFKWNIHSMNWDEILDVIINIEDFCILYNKIPYIEFAEKDCIDSSFFWKLTTLLKSKNISFSILLSPLKIEEDLLQMLAVCGCEKVIVEDVNQQIVNRIHKANIKLCMINDIDLAAELKVDECIYIEMNPCVSTKIKVYEKANCTTFFHKESNNFITIQDNGDVCCFSNSKPISLFEDRLADIWECQKERNE